MKDILKAKGVRIWMIAGAILVVLLLAVNLVANYFSSIISIALGGDRPYEVDKENAVVYYETETSSKDEANERAAEVTRRVAEEGIILLRNEAEALPLESGAKLSVFGKNSVNLVYGGSGSGGGDNTFAKKTLYESLEAAEFEVNEALKEFYEDDSRSGPPRPANSSDLNTGDTQSSIDTGETDIGRYTSEITSTYAAYNDAALVVFSRIGGEGSDLPMTEVEESGDRAGARHYLALDTDERDLLAHVGEHFDKVIVILNTLNIVEAGFLQEYGVDACLWIGGPGSTGIMALGDILNGTVTPSGHTTDTWAANFTKDPTFNNFSARAVANGDTYRNAETGRDTTEHFVNYEESVYMGYRYYETRAEQERAKSGGSDAWYEENVIYPFGYGLSYTSFAWEVTDAESIEDVSISAEGAYEVTVKVTNTGAYAGKDVVQVYAKLPYEAGGIEKPYEVLVGFAKTPLLYPEGEANGADKPNSCEVTISVDPYYFASYDYTGKSGFTGYVLEGGEYSLLVNSDAHTVREEIPFSVSGDITYLEDPVTGNDVVNRYTDCENSAFDADTQLEFLMSREDLSVLPDAPQEADRDASAQLLGQIADRTHNNLEAAEYTMPTQGSAATPLANVIRHDEETDTYYADYEDGAWEQVLSALSVNDLANLYNNGAFQTVRLDRINKPQTLESDGPVGWCNFISLGTDDTWKGNNVYTSQVVMSATWNTELIYEMGECVGEEGLWGAKRTAEEDGLPYSGWYSPGVNLHRSPFGGRNFEYFSEDPFLTGMIASAEVQGCQSKGVNCYVKHFAVNEQETHRNGGCSWVTEQAMRELYLRPFEMTVKIGKTRAMMSSFNRIGTRWTGGDYRLLTEILRGEWGFEGTVISDYNENSSYMDPKQMIYAGGDLNLCSNRARMWSDYDSGSAADVTVLRRAAKNVLYTTMNSNMINSFNYRYAMAYWKMGLIIADCVVAAGIVAWGITVIAVAARKKAKNEQV